MKRISYIISSLFIIISMALIFENEILSRTGDYYLGSAIGEIVLYSIVYIMIFSWLVPKIFTTILGKISTALTSILFLSYMMYNISFYHRVSFGNTWEGWEVFCELTLSNWFFLLLSLGTISLFAINYRYTKISTT